MVGERVDQADYWPARQVTIIPTSPAHPTKTRVLSRPAFWEATVRAAYRKITAVVNQNFHCICQW